MAVFKLGVRPRHQLDLPSGGNEIAYTLLFGGAGAVGVMITSWITCFFYFFPDDPVRAFAGGIISAAAPYLTYRLAQYAFGLRASLTNLTAGRLLFLIVMYSFASPSMHHLWFLARRDDVSASGFCVMFVGDLLGSLVVVYTMKTLLSFLPVKPPGIAK